MMRVLIATPDHVLGGNLAAELAAIGLDTCEAFDGLEALESAAGVDAAFLDVGLPIFDGLTVATRLREDPDIPSDLPIILVTGHDTNPHAIDAAGVTMQLNKTHSADELRELVGRVLFGA